MVLCYILIPMPKCLNRQLVAHMRLDGDDLDLDSISQVNLRIVFPNVRYSTFSSCS